ATIALKIGVSELRIDAKPAVVYWVLIVISEKGSAVLIRPTTRRCAQCSLNTGHKPRCSISGISTIAATSERLALSGMAPKCGTAKRINMKEPPHNEASTTRMNNWRIFKEMASQAEIDC